MIITPAKKKILIIFSSIFLGLGLAFFALDRVFLDYSADGSIPIDNNAAVEEYFDGVITYISPSIYPEDEISYSLNDHSGKEIILLKSKDEMLVVSEGLRARVYGKIFRTKDGKTSYLMVERVVINNATN